MSEQPEVWLYGSRARGDSDARSDTDLLIITDEGVDTRGVVHELESAYSRVEASAYSWREVERMAAYGSLFLRHIAIEGVRLLASARYPDRLPSLIQNLPPFSRAEEDLSAFRMTVHESRVSLLDGGWVDFECEVIATVVRHAAILGTHLIGKDEFGRERPFFVCGSALGWSEADIFSLASEATRWRKHDQHERPDAAELLSIWLELVDRFIDDLGILINDRNHVLPSAA